MKSFPPSELVLNDLGQVYHLALTPGDVAETIILVGDPGRVEVIASFFDEITFKINHREFYTVTGTYKDKSISVISTGIGTDNIDIVINELDALFNIDLNTRTEKEVKTKLDLIRIGTCGLIQKETDLHCFILSTGAIGLDNVAHFYPLNYTEEETNLLSAFKTFLSFPETIQPYFVNANESLISKFDSNQVAKGLTVTASGFYGPQGRSLRLGLSKDDINECLTDFSFSGRKIQNFEMESSALFALGKGLGHQCVTLCLGVANRTANTFSKGYDDEMKQLIHYVLERI